MTSVRPGWFRFHLATLVFVVLVVSTLLALNLVPRYRPHVISMIIQFRGDPRKRFFGWPVDWGEYMEGVEQGRLWMEWDCLGVDAFVCAAIAVLAGVFFERWFTRKGKR